MTNPFLYFMQVLRLRATCTANATHKSMDFVKIAPFYRGECAKEPSLRLKFWTPPRSPTATYISNSTSRLAFSGPAAWPPVVAMTNPFLYFMQDLAQGIPQATMKNTTSRAGRYWRTND
ncbi:hypothetical protein HPB50_018770 [Hyalomma asiaticum]|uniref:Uncharacterized protein n=1 Tax=Hyalomma asiaticum TaxID=266040 RepID=A0ACB7S7J5_HYAAI|nr:hypothetical protein HPB50_018770 [Hyalomma asiaticum]